MASIAPDSQDVRDELIAFVLTNAASAKLLKHAPTRTSEESMEARRAVSGETVTGAKALLIKLDVRDRPDQFAVLVLPGFNKLDSKVVKNELKGRISGFRNFRFATPEEMAQRARGIQPGKMPPFGRPFFPDIALTFIDADLLNHKRIGFNAADFEQSIILNTDDYLKLVKHDGTFALSTG